MHVWIKFEDGDPLGHKFLEIQEETGLHSKAEVMRHLIKRYRLKKQGGNG